MSREGYKDIEPLGGFKDKGRDAIQESKLNGEITIFIYSVREDWEKKLFEDLLKIKNNKHKCNRIVYVTTGSPTSNDKDTLKMKVATEYGWILEIYDLERIRTLIDNQYSDLKRLHPNIFALSIRSETADEVDTPFDRKRYAEYLLLSYQEWLDRYTPLLAEHRELESLAIPFGTQSSNQKGIPVIKIAEETSISILLGESGSGKTTAFWRIIVDSSKALLEGRDGRIPVLINLRSWNDLYHCKELLLHEFANVDTREIIIERELRAGNCLILLDGLNELPPVNILRKQAIVDIQRFLVDYPLNRFIINCRTSDYDPEEFNIDQLFPRIPRPRAFEIRRLDLDQINDYVRRYFKDSHQLSEKLLDDLGTSNKDLWENKASLLHLARIPLYLQLIINEFKREQKLPKNKAQLLGNMLHRSLLRDSAGPSKHLDYYAKENLLSFFAYAAILKGHSLRIPDQVAQSILKNVTEILKNNGLIQNDLTFGLIWQEVLSSNYLRISEWRWVEWLHQLILDYFLSCVITRIYSSDEQNEIVTLNSNINKHTWEQACIISLGMLDPLNGAKFLSNMINIDSRIATIAFENQNVEQSQAISDALIPIVVEGVQDSESLTRVALALPYLPVINNFYTSFRGNSDPIRILIAKAISEMVIKYYPLIMMDRKINSFWGWPERLEFNALDQGQILLGVKRGIELLTTWINNRNDYVRFYSAKGLWEKDKGTAARILSEIWIKNDPALKSMISSLRSQWGII